MCSKCKSNLIHIYNINLNKYLILFATNVQIINEEIVYEDDYGRSYVFDQDLDYDSIGFCKRCFYNYVTYFYERDMRVFKLGKCDICFHFLSIEDENNWILDTDIKSYVIFQMTEIDNIFYVNHFKHKYHEFITLSDIETSKYMNCCTKCFDLCESIITKLYYFKELPFYNCDNSPSYKDIFKRLFNNNPKSLFELSYKSIKNDIDKVRIFQNYSLSFKNKFE